MPNVQNLTNTKEQVIVKHIINLVSGLADDIVLFRQGLTMRVSRC
jgi:ABC-type enterochelin transport system ATPase subunit